MTYEQETETAPVFYCVAVYLVTREYGGPEEGGWYYDMGVPCLDKAAMRYFNVYTEEAAALRYKNVVQEILNAHPRWNNGRPKYTSVNGIGEYRAVITEDKFPATFPAEKPHYE